MTAEVFNKVFEIFKAITTCDGMLDTIDDMHDKLDLLCKEQNVYDKYNKFFSAIASLLGELSYSKATARDIIKSKGQYAGFSDSATVESYVSSIIACYLGTDFTEIILYANTQYLKGNLVISDFYKFLMDVYNIVQSEFIIVMAFYAVVQEKINNYNYDYILKVLKNQFVIKHFQILLIIKAMDETMAKSFVMYSEQVTNFGFKKAFDSVVDKSGI